MSRIGLHDSILDVMSKMSEGNPGALTVCVRCYKEGEKIDPESAMGGITALLNMDALELYGSKIWMLYKDVCGEDLTKTIAMLRAWQLGIVTRVQLKHAVENYGEGVDVDKTLENVMIQLPEFGRTQ